MKFRFHRGDVGDSLATEVDVPTLDAMVEHINRHHQGWGLGTVRQEDIVIQGYGRDERIGWSTWLVSIRDGHVVGMLEGSGKDTPTVFIKP